jgi:tetratricopeptide (TPR) repeat protein
VAKVYVFLCRLHGLEPPGLRQVEQDVERANSFAAECERSLGTRRGAGPSFIPLELKCRQCARKYHYEVHDVHIHPRSEKKSEEAANAGLFGDGVVVVDDLRCKNCGTLNQFELTPRSFTQLAAESLRMLAIRRLGRHVSATAPVKHVVLGHKDGRPMTLAELDEDFRRATRDNPGKPQAHLALAKFYEYVKASTEARNAFLKTLDLDSLAIEAMAGLARLDLQQGRDLEAYQWLEDCYRNLEKGHVYLAEGVAEFKKTVRDKRRDLARRLNRKPEGKPVTIQFRAAAPDYPKNRPCPCGSGKKYKLCCMERS